MLIRGAKTVDYPQLREVYLASRRQSFHWLNSDDMNLYDFDENTLEEKIFLAEENNKILGFILLYVPDRFIHLLFVHPEATGQGVMICCSNMLSKCRELQSPLYVSLTITTL